MRNMDGTSTDEWASSKGAMLSSCPLSSLFSKIIPRFDLFGFESS